MLDSILSLRVNTGSIVIKDFFYIEGIEFMRAIVKRWLKEKKFSNVQFYSCFNDDKRFKEDEFSDKLEWKTIDLKKNNSDCFESIEIPIIANVKFGSLIIIDCLNFLALVKGITSVCSFLSDFKFNSKNVSLICLLHSDAIYKKELDFINHYAQTLMELKEVTDDKYFGLVEISHKSLLGSIKCSKHLVNLLSNYTIINSCPTLSTDKIISNNQDPLSGLTFKLSLKSSEKEDRNKLNPPYLDAAKKTDSFIEYATDEYDDIDEEDPDDDLDI